MPIKLRLNRSGKSLKTVFTALLLVVYITSLFVVTITACEGDSRWAEILPVIFGAIAFFITLYLLNFIKMLLKHKVADAHFERPSNRRFTIGGDLASIDRSLNTLKIDETNKFSLSKHYHIQLWYSYSRLSLTCMMRNCGVILMIWDVLKLFLWMVTISYWRRNSLTDEWNYDRVPQYIYPFHFFVISASTVEMLMFLLETNDFKEIVTTPIFWINSLLLPPLIILAKWLFFSELSYIQVYWMHGFLIWIKLFVWVGNLLNVTNDGSDKSRYITKVGLELFAMSCCFAGSMYVMQGVHPNNSVDQFYYTFVQYIELFYFAIITISTVGYGDVKPMTLESKFAALFFISWVLIWVPITINRTIEMILNNSKISGHLSTWATTKSFVLLLGDVDPFQLSQFISKIYYSSERIKLILLTPNDIEMYTNQINQSSTLGVQVCILKGDVDLSGNINFLETLKARSAQSIFVLSTFKGGDIRKNDMKTIVRAVSVRKYGCNSDNIIIQFCSPVGHDVISKPIGIGVNLYELKSSIITKNIVCPGIITLIVNLTLNQNYSIAQKNPHSLNTTSLGFYHWYLRGAAKRLCIHPLPSEFIGCTFESLCARFYNLNGLIMIGIIRNEDDRAYVINPSGSEYYIKNCDTGIFIRDLTSRPMFDEARNDGVNDDSAVIARNSLLTNFIKNGLLNVRSEAIEEMANYEIEREYDEGDPQSLYKSESLLPSMIDKRMSSVFEKGNIVVNSVSTACNCVFKNQGLPVVVIIGFSEFIIELLNRFGKYSLFNVILMGDKISKILDMNLLKRFDTFLAVIDVDLMRHADIIAAELHKASYVYVTPNTLDGNKVASDHDLSTIVIYRQIKNILKSVLSMDNELLSNIFSLVELKNSYNVTYLDDSKWSPWRIFNEYVDSSLSYINSNEYAMGQVISDEMLYNAVTTSFSTTDSDIIYNILLDMVNIRGSKRKHNGIELIDVAKLELPEGRKTFGLLFNHMLSERGSIVIGIYRMYVNDSIEEVKYDPFKDDYTSTSP